MSDPEPMQIKVAFFDEAHAQEPGIIRVSVPDAGLGDEPGEPAPPIVAAVVIDPNLPAPVVVQQDAITIGALPMWAVAIVWVIAVILNAQAVKLGLKATGLKERLGALRWKRWMFCVPIAVGAAQGYLLGPRVAAAFHFEFDASTAMFLMGVPSGAAAPWVYMAFRHVVMPLLPATAIGLIERVTGIALPDEVKAKVNDSGIFDTPSEVLQVPREPK